VTELQRTLYVQTPGTSLRLEGDTVTNPSAGRTKPARIATPTSAPPPRSSPRSSAGPGADRAFMAGHRQRTVADGTNVGRLLGPPPPNSSVKQAPQRQFQDIYRVARRRWAWTQLELSAQSRPPAASMTHNSRFYRAPRARQRPRPESGSKILLSTVPCPFRWPDRRAEFGCPSGGPGTIQANASRIARHRRRPAPPGQLHQASSIRPATSGRLHNGAGRLASRAPPHALRQSIPAVRTLGEQVATPPS
jgi:hypothetical protein